MYEINNIISIIVIDLLKVLLWLKLFLCYDRTQP